MIESELAFNKDGEPFAVPDTVTAWRVRRLRGGRGAPELVYGPDGSPLTLEIDAGMDELRDAVDTTGRYRLDAIDDGGKAVANVSPGYVHVTVNARNSSMPSVAEAPVLNSTDHAIRELVRAQVELVRTNSELAKSVATQQPDLIRAAAEILRAADGAGMPRREALGEWDGEGADGGETAEQAASPGVNWAEVAQGAIGAVKALAGLAMAKAAGGAGAAATPAPSAPSAAKHSEKRADRADPPGASEVPEEPTVAPSAAVDPDAHMMAIQAQLTPAERTFVFGVINKLSVADLMQWRDQLAQMSVDDAVAMLRAEIAKRKESAS